MNPIRLYEEAVRALERSEITLGEFKERIEPLMDAEVVVRCKDCKYMPSAPQYDKSCWCRRRHGDDGNRFCADGKEK